MRRSDRPAVWRCSPGRWRRTWRSNFQRSQDTLYALAKDSGGKAMFDFNDLSAGIVDAANALTAITWSATTARTRRRTASFVRVKVTLTRDLKLT
jgi:hypothetical protein